MPRKYSVQFACRNCGYQFERRISSDHIVTQTTDETVIKPDATSGTADGEPEIVVCPDCDTDHNIVPQR